ncbi:phosducin-like protein [Prorops nasuta]|uniref:phosducin-like protein n=1 Tax=Prorops nasuta TaxID=863751 RepID=UPI0034CDEBEA
MSTLEDKILGEKAQYYCSSSEDENNDSPDSDKEENEPKEQTGEPASVAPFSKWGGTSSNTGPKGVLKDWQQYKKAEAEKRIEEDQKRLSMIKKISLTCQSSLEEDKDKLLQLDPELAELLADEFLVQYQKQRMQEMIAKAEKLTFGKLIVLKSADQFLEAIDKEDPLVKVIIHIYEDNIPGCETMNGCLLVLAKEHPHVKFCIIRGSTAGLSDYFKKRGVPALLIYKHGQLIGNYVRITEYLGTDFYASDVQSFLVEHGMLSDKRCIPEILKPREEKSSESD